MIKRQKQLIQFLPDWKEAQTSGIFAKNFFLDLSIDLLKEEATKLFAKMRKIIHISEVVPENQLRGYFIIEGGKAKLKVSFTLTPENPALIQHYQIEEKH